MLKCGGDDCTVRRPNLMGILECRQKCGRFCYNELLEFIMHAILWKRKMMLQPLNVHHIHTHTQLQLQTSIECVQWTMHLCVVWSQPVKSRVYRQTPLWLSVCWTWLPETSKSECISRNQLHKVVTYIYKWFCCHQNNIIDANAKYHSTLDKIHSTARNWWPDWQAWCTLDQRCIHFTFDRRMYVLACRTRTHKSNFWLCQQSVSDCKLTTFIDIFKFLRFWTQKYYIFIHRVCSARCDFQSANGQQIFAPIRPIDAATTYIDWTFCIHFVIGFYLLLFFCVFLFLQRSHNILIRNACSNWTNWQKW